MDGVHEQQHETENVYYGDQHRSLGDYGIGDHLDGVAHHEAYQCCYAVGHRAKEAHFGEQAHAQQSVGYEHRQKLHEETDDLRDWEFDELIHNNQLLIVSDQLEDRHPGEEARDARQSSPLDARHKVECGDDLEDIAERAEDDVELKYMKIVLHLNFRNSHLISLHPFVHIMPDLIVLLLADQRVWLWCCCQMVVRFGFSVFVIDLKLVHLFV